MEMRPQSKGSSVRRKFELRDLRMPETTPSKRENSIENFEEDSFDVSLLNNSHFKQQHFDTIKEESIQNHHFPVFDDKSALLEQALVDHSPNEIVTQIPCHKKTLMMGPRKPFQKGIDSYSIPLEVSMTKIVP